MAIVGQFGLHDHSCTTFYGVHTTENSIDKRTILWLIFEEKDWPAPPAEFDMYTLYREFDVNHDYALEEFECLNFAHAVVSVLYRSIQ